MKNTILLMLIAWASSAQECNPYHLIPRYEYSDNKSFGLGYVACLHARGVVAEVGYDKVFLGVLAMGEGHKGATYSFLQYDYSVDRLRLYGGPAYRLNNNPSLIIGRFGIDYMIYKNVYGTLSILVIDKDLNYLHYGIKINY